LIRRWTFVFCIGPDLQQKKLKVLKEEPFLKECRNSNQGRGWRPTKRLGQHFLRETGIIHRIISLARFDPSSYVLEVGPGLGALTLPLSQNVAHVYAVEKDAHLVERLDAELRRRSIGNVTLMNQDILRLDFEALPSPSGTRIDVIGNLPYNISTPFLERLLDNRTRIGRAVLMFQKEVAKRLVASPGGKEYGSLTVLMQYHARIFPMLDVPRSVFYPVPKVDSMVIGLDFQDQHVPRVSEEETLKKVVRGAFCHRRKTLLNSFKGSPFSFSQEGLRAACIACGIDPGKRAEALTIDDFICLTTHLIDRVS